MNRYQAGGNPSGYFRLVGERDRFLTGREHGNHIPLECEGTNEDDRPLPATPNLKALHRNKGEFCSQVYSVAYRFNFIDDEA